MNGAKSATRAAWGKRFGLVPRTPSALQSPVNLARPLQYNIFGVDPGGPVFRAHTEGVRAVL